MAFKTHQELEKQYEKDVTFKDRVGKLFAVRNLYRDAIRSQTFSPAEELASALELNDQGSRLVEIAIKDFDCSTESAKFCVFLLLFHHSLLVDVEKTKIAKILDCLSQDILSSRVTYPWLFDHLLYDRAFQTLLQRPRQLSVQQTEALLSGMPTGVFQVGNFTVGPLGVMQSEERRWFIPRLDLPLYHCEDQMCGDLHVADLAQLDDKHRNITNSLRRVLNAEEGPASEWRDWIRGLISHRYWYDDFALANLVWLLGDGFSHSEMQLIGEQIISRGKQAVRGRIPANFAELFSASSSAIASKLSKPQLLQVALISPDEVIAAVIDDLVAEKKLKIPITEVRKVVAAAPAPSWTGAVPECSDLGIRVIGRGRVSDPLARLKRLVLEIHKSDDAQAQLKWSLRQIPGSTVADQLESLMWIEPPSKLLRNLVVNNIGVLKSALSHLRAEHLVLPNREDEESVFVQRLLWKLGFGKTQFESSVAQFWDRLKNFERVVSSAKQEDESWISAVRSVGVNLFVGLEELLNNALAFLCWVFLTDPLSDSHVYNNKKGRALVAQELNGLMETEKGAVTYDPSGKNTMFPLIMGFSALAKRIQCVIDAHASYAKPKLLLAHYYGKNSLQLFPYRHDRYVCDGSSSDVELIRRVCNETTTKLQQSRVFEIRNKLEHNNEEVPSAKEMVKAIELLAEVVTTLQSSGLLPVIFATKTVETDAFGRAWVVSQDGLGHEVKWQPSPALRAIKSLPGINEPQIIVSGFRIPETNEPLRFGVEEDSDYTKMWQDYPKHGKHSGPTDKTEMPTAIPAVCDGDAVPHNGSAAAREPQVEPSFTLGQKGK